MNILSLLFFITLSHANSDTIGEQTRTPEYFQVLDKLLQRPCVIEVASTWFFICDDADGHTVFWINTRHSIHWRVLRAAGFGRISVVTYPYRGATVRFTRDSHGHVYYSLSDSITGKKLVSKTHVPISDISIPDRLLK